MHGCTDYGAPTDDFAVEPLRNLSEGSKVIKVLCHKPRPLGCHCVSQPGARQAYPIPCMASGVVE